MAEKELTEDDLKNMSAEEIAELQKQNCIFCKISSKEIPAKIVHEDADVICILDINPAAEGHILVYPKKHYMIMPHMPDDLLAKLFKNVRLMSHTLLKTLQCKGTTIFVANGVAAGQKAPHVLIHVFPRRENDGLVQLPKYEMSEEQIDKLRAQLKPYLNQLYGVRRPVIKDAEFSEKREEHKDKEKKDHEGSEADKKRKDESGAHHHKPDHDKKDHEDSDGEERDHDEDDKKKGHKDHGLSHRPSNAKVDLDDIAKLFGR